MTDLQPLKDLYLVEVFLTKYTATTQQLSLGQRESWSFDKP